MSKIHCNFFIGATDAVITPRSKAQLLIGANNRRTIKIPCFSEGRVNRVYVRQVGGTPVGFDVELLTSAAPYAVGEVPVGAPWSTPNANPASFRAFPKQVATASGQAHDWWEPWGSPFINQDQKSQTDNQRALYLTIFPTGAAAITGWEVTIVTSTDASD